MEISKWLLNNGTWLFSGIGVGLIGFIWKFIFNKKNASIKQIQKSGKNSMNIQSGGDVNFNSYRNNDDN